MALFSISSRSSVDRALARCLGGHGPGHGLGSIPVGDLLHARVMLMNSAGDWE